MSGRGQEIASLLSSPQQPVEEEEVQPKDLAQELIGRQKARTSLIDFAKFVDPNYRSYQIHEHIAHKLEAVEAGHIRRLAIFVPPAIGKSRLASEIFPAWFFGRNPGLEFIVTSYDHDLPKGFGREARNIIKHPKFRLIFPEVNVSDDASAVDSFKTNQGGEFKGEGVGGGLVGFHGNVAIIDDPFKGRAEASSLSRRKFVWDWYAGTLVNRLREYKDGPGAIVLIMQRWHDDDLGGRVVKMVGDGQQYWDIVKVPSLALEEDPLGRAPGEALLTEGPNKRSREELLDIQSLNPASFMAVHQQEPVPDEGELFKPAWLREYSQDELPKELVVYGCSDHALSKGSGDYTVHIVFGVCSNNHVWILELWREQCDINEGVQSCITLMEEHRPLKWFHEKTGGASKAATDVLRKVMRESSIYVTLEAISVIGRGGKDSEARAGSAAGAMQMGYFHVPSFASWRGELDYELSRFPNGRHDDQVDAIALIGMKLPSLRGRGKRTVDDGEFDGIKPVNWRFDQILNRSGRKRRGKKLSREAPVLVAPDSVMHEDYE